MTKSWIIAVLLGVFAVRPSAAENYSFGAEENILRGIRVAQPAVARDSLTPPKDVPSLYRTECGSCHGLYPPNLLADGGIFSETSGWKEIMDDLHNHFGDNAELDESARLQIRKYLVENAAGSERRFGSRTDPARLTATLWFRRTHGRVKCILEICAWAVRKVVRLVTCVPGTGATPGKMSFCQKCGNGQRAQTCTHEDEVSIRPLRKS